MLVDLKKAETRKARSTGNVKQKQNKKAVFEGLIRKIRVWRRRGPNFGKKRYFWITIAKYEDSVANRNFH